MVGIISLILCLFFWGNVAAETLTKDYFERLFEEKVLAELPYDPQEVEISRLYCQPQVVEIPGKDFEVRAHLLSRVLRPGLVTMLVDISSNGRLIRRVRVAGRLEIYQKILVTKRDLPRGSEVFPEDLTLVRFPLSRLPQDVISDPEDLRDKVLKRSLRAGSPLRASLLKPRPLVRRGEMVTIVAESGALKVTALGEAREDGAKGEIIRVKNVATRKEVMAQVVGPNLVKVRF
ncbi:flagellar basal body P-ring formation chaperone FlgA [Thermosulfuriphilus sp.]